MSSTTVGRVCLPRIRSGTEIVAFHITEKCLKPWRRVNVLGVERAGVVPARVRDPDDGITLISPTELDTSFPIDGRQTNHVRFTNLDYNLQRLWDYDALWEKDSVPPKLRLDETWVILDRNRNIAMLSKEYPYPESGNIKMPEGYLRGKIEVVDSYRINYQNIKIPSLWEAAKSINLLLELVKPVQNTSPRLADFTTLGSEPTTTDQPIALSTTTVASSATLSVLSQISDPNKGEDKITASIISNLLSGRDLGPSKLEHLQSNKFEIKNDSNRQELISVGIKDKVTYNFDAWKDLGKSKTILNGLSLDKLKELNDFAREKRETQNCFAQGLFENDELKRLLAKAEEVEPQLRTSA